MKKRILLSVILILLGCKPRAFNNGLNEESEVRAGNADKPCAKKYKVEDEDFAQVLPSKDGLTFDAFFATLSAKPEFKRNANFVRAKFPKVTGDAQLKTWVLRAVRLNWNNDERVTKFLRRERIICEVQSGTRCVSILKPLFPLGSEIS